MLVSYVLQLCQELFVDNLVIRQSNGVPWKANKFRKVFQDNENAYKEKKLGDPGTCYEMLKSKITHAATKVAYHSYCKLMEMAIREERDRVKKPFVQDQDIVNYHGINANKAEEIFRLETRYFKLSITDFEELSERINEWFVKRRKENNHLIEMRQAQDDFHNLNADYKNLEEKAAREKIREDQERKMLEKVQQESDRKIAGESETHLDTESSANEQFWIRVLATSIATAIGLGGIGVTLLNPIVGSVMGAAAVGSIIAAWTIKKQE